MKSLWATTRDSVRTQLWPIPSIAVVAALVMGLLVPRLDAHVDGSLPGWLSSVIFGGDAGAASTLLDAISSSLITVTSLTFSLTVVTLQLASSQFSPRLLRTFTRDLFVQATLALFLTTFIFSMTLLRAVRSPGSGAPFVPRIGVTVAFLLVAASVLGLVLFLAHLVEQIRVETMLRNVHTDATSTLRSVLPEREPAGMLPDRTAPTPYGPTVDVHAEVEGFVTWIAQEPLRQAVADAGLVVELDVHPGVFLVRGRRIGRAWRLPGTDADDAIDTDHLAQQLCEHVHTGFERTAAQDVGYGVRQLTDVANKALSPGINDPTTAIHALAHLSSLLCDISERDLGPTLVRDEGQRVQLVLHGPSFADLLEQGISQPARYGAADAQVVGALFGLLRDLSVRVPPDQRQAVASQLLRLRAKAAASDFDEDERLGFERVAREVDTNLLSPAGPGVSR